MVRLKALFLKLWSFNLALLDQALVSGINFVTGVLAARILTPIEFGQYVLAFTVIFAVNTFQSALVVDPMLSIGAKKTSDVAVPYFSAILLHQGALSIALCTMMFVAYSVASFFFSTWGLEALIWPLVLTTTAFQWQEFMRRYFFARGRVLTATINDAVRYGTQIVGVIAVMRWATAPTSSDLLLVVAASGAISLGHAAIYFGPVRWRRDIIGSSFREHWRYSAWLVPTSGLRAANSATLISAAGYFYGAGAAGVLRAAQNLVAFVHIFYMGLDSIGLAKAAQALSLHGTNALRNISLKLAIVGGGTIIIALAIVGLSAKWLLILFYGDRYQGIEYLVHLWALSYAVMFFNLPLGITLRALEVTKPLFIAEVLQSVFVIVAFYPLLKFLGPSGTVVGVLFQNLIVVVYFTSVLLKGFRHGGGFGRQQYSGLANAQIGGKATAARQS
jgi:O-antigen/teichoic acid export membrane protein